jgi:hypothetical protein
LGASHQQQPVGSSSAFFGGTSTIGEHRDHSLGFGSSLSLEARPAENSAGPGIDPGEASTASAVVTSDNTLLKELARRERELAAAQRRIAETEAELADVEREAELHGAQEAALKEAVRDLQREVERLKLASKTIDVEYLKNILVRLFETGQEESLLPAVATVLQFSPAEADKCRQAVRERQAHGAAMLVKAGGESAAQMSTYLSSWLGLGGAQQPPR